MQLPAGLPYENMSYTDSALLSTTVLDLHWTGRPRSIAAALLRSGNTNAIVDPGPSSTLSTLREQLSRQGLSISRLDFILLTHIHLDHAGATGSLLKENSNLQVFVHSRGAPHIVDPAKLLQSAARLYGESMNALFGESLPVPAANVHALYGGETLPLGGDSIFVLYTPGHASHHVTYFDPLQRTAFVGDTGGICIEGHPMALPAAPPPDIDVELWNGSLDAIERLQPRRLFLTHFGFSDQAVRHITNYRARLRRWSEIAARIIETGMEDPEAMQEFVRRASEETEAMLTPEELAHYHYNGQLGLSWLGLARYHRKRLAPPGP
jgi:glyoxylase-like metal-dependent hydrolase (beta-lactamase superfamily II)